LDTLSPQPIVDAELLRAFVTFAEELNFTRAARRLGLSQPAFFERIRRLSDQAGVKLYEREGRALELTAQGVELCAFGRDLLARGAAFAGRLRGETRESVTLAAGEGAYLYLLGPALKAFARDPAQLEVLTLGGPSASAAVQRGEAHLAVGVFDLVPRGLQARELLSAPVCAALPKRHALARSARVRLAELTGSRFIMAPEGQSHRALVGRALASVGATVTPPVVADGWPLMLAFVAAELGVAVVNGTCRPPAGVVLRPIPELGVVKYHLLSRAGTHGDAVERLAGLIRRSVQS